MTVCVCVCVWAGERARADRTGESRCKFISWTCMTMPDPTASNRNELAAGSAVRLLPECIDSNVIITKFRFFLSKTFLKIQISAAIDLAQLCVCVCAARSLLNYCFSCFRLFRWLPGKVFDENDYYRTRAGRTWTMLERAAVGKPKVKVAKSSVKCRSKTNRTSSMCVCVWVGG